MQINRRLTNGLAWAGLFVVVAVPVADAISGQLMGDRATANIAMVGEEAPVPAPLSQRPDAPVKSATQVAAIAPAKPVPQTAAVKPAATAGAVDNFLTSGKKLPSYITDADAPAAVASTPAPAKPVVTAPVETVAVAPQPIVAPAPTAVEPVAVDPVEVATLTPQHIAPVPMPLSMRPQPVTRPLASDRDIVLPPEVVARNDAPVVVVDDLQDWESGPLSDFLAARRGQRSSDDQYSFRERPVQRRRDIYVGPEDDEIYYPFAN